MNFDPELFGSFYFLLGNILKFILITRTISLQFNRIQVSPVTHLMCGNFISFLPLYIFPFTLFERIILNVHILKARAVPLFHTLLYLTWTPQQPSPPRFLFSHSNHESLTSVFTFLSLVFKPGMNYKLR